MSIEEPTISRGEAGGNNDTRTYVVPSLPFDEVLNENHKRLFESFDLSRNFLSKSQLASLKELASVVSQSPRLRSLIGEELDRSRQDAAGYLILDFSNAVGDQLSIRDYITLTAVCTVFGEPFGAFERFGLWKPVGVDPSVDSWRAGGTGLNPQHIDFVNATLPPDFTCFFCVREDPLRGGESVISNHLKAFSRLTSQQKELALTAGIYEGKFFNLVGIGKELQPFPLYEPRSNGEMMCRFTAKSLFVAGETDSRYVSLIRDVSYLLDEYSTTFQLKSKQLMVVDQGIACHGRLPLGAGQADVAADKRRLLMQVFMKK